MKTLHYGNTPATPDEQLGYDMRVLLERYAANPTVLNWTKYKIMDRVFSEQFVTDSRAELKKNPGGKILLNPSDPDAEIGHKGAGYQAQIMQTYGEQNQVQMITDILPQGASASDMDSLPTMVERSVQAGTKPEVLLTDAGYGSDSNVCHSKRFDIEQIAPTTGKKKGQLGLEECTIDEFKRILICPGGKRPFKSTFTDGKGSAIFFKSTCESCPMKANCPARKYGKQNYKWEYAEVNLRLRERRLNETTDSFKNEYRPRNGIEALNGNLKQNTALRRLRCRGRLAVHSAIYLIAAMHKLCAMRPIASKTDLTLKMMISRLFFPCSRPLF